MDSLSLVELKKIAKERRIKQYYIMKRAQLIQLLSMTDLPQSIILEKKTILELRQEAKAKGLRGFWRMSRGDILELLYPDAQKDNKDNSKAAQHNEPERHDSKNVWVEVSKNPLENRS